MVTCYLRDTNKFLRYRTPRTIILKCGFPTKAIELTRLVLFEVLEMSQLRGTSVQTISAGTARKFAECRRSYGVRNFSVVGYVGELRIGSQHRVFPFSGWPRERFRKERRIHTSQRGFHSERCSVREAFIQRARKQSESFVLRVFPDKEFLHTKKINNRDVYVDYGARATEDIPENTCSVRRHYYG